MSTMFSFVSYGPWSRSGVWCTNYYFGVVELFSETLVQSCRFLFCSCFSPMVLNVYKSKDKFLYSAVSSP